MQASQGSLSFGPMQPLNLITMRFVDSLACSTLNLQPLFEWDTQPNVTHPDSRPLSHAEHQGQTGEGTRVVTARACCANV